MDKLSTIVTSLVVMALAPLGAAQAADSGFYIGGSVGQSALEAPTNDVELPELPTEFDENDTAWKVFAGYKWQLPLFNLGVEGGYVNFGKPGTSFEVDSTPVTLEAEPTGVNLWATGGVAVGPVDLYAKLGYVFWDIEATISDGIDSESVSDDGSDIGYGVGGRLNLGRFGIRLEYETYDVEDTDNLSMWSLGAEYRF